jgi:preprotein translocase subunit SecG
MQLLINFLLAIYVLVALLMMLVILMQRPKSEGLGAAFGGGVTENIFGAQTTNVLVKFTGWLAGIFFALTFALSILYAHKTSGDTGLRRELMKQETGAATSPTVAPTSGQSPTKSSPAPDSGAGVLPAGSVAPAATAGVRASSMPQASPVTSAKPKPSPR